MSSRSQRTNRAFNFLIAAVVSAVLAVVLLFASGFGLFLLFALIAGGFGYAFRRSVS